MNIIFLTQGSTLSVFYDVMTSLRKNVKFDNIGFYISDSAYYDKFKDKNPEIKSCDFEILKEWEIFKKAQTVKPDIYQLKRYEEQLGDPFLWNAIIADRRIFYGKYSTLEQDYPSRYSHDQMMSILQAGVEEMGAFFNRVKPDIVVGFICVTIGEYLAYLTAKSRNILFLNLRPTRIKNYFFGGESALEPSARLEAEYERMLKEGISGEVRNEVFSVLDSVRKTHAMYEGVLPANKSLYQKTNKQNPILKKGLLTRITSNIGVLIREYFNYNFGEYRYDNQYRGVFYPTWFLKVKRPLRIKLTEASLRPKYIKSSQLATMEYAFYPLHKEPEVTLLVYSRPYINQIEVIRNFARSLPVGMKLVVKEHPVSVGYRPLSYYKKLLAIPNVLLIHPEMTSREIIQKARLVFIISGSVGLESIMLKKPVIHIGRIPFSILPDSMIRHVKDLDRLPWEVHDLLENHKHDEESLIAYIAAVVKTSVPIDFYSELLGRKGVYRLESESEKGEIRSKHIDRLADYILNIFLNAHQHSKVISKITTSTFN